MKKFSLSAVAVLCLFGVSAGEVINLNSSMELGVPGKGVPGYYFDVNKVHVDEVAKNLDKVYRTVTVPDGKDGMCLKIPGYTAVSGYQLESSEMLITRSGEVEISFDAKIGPDENGVMQPQKSFAIDFRCYADGDVDKYYPMLRRFSFRPDTQWKTFKKRFKVKAYSYYYHIWVLTEGLKSGDTANSLYLDNFKLRYVDGKDVEPEEYAVIPDCDEHLYAPGKTAKLDVRARINSGKKSIDAVLKVKKEYNGEVAASIPVKLERDKNGTFVGKCEYKFNQFGAFTTELAVSGRKLRGINGTLLSLHPAVKHDFRSFGWRIGCNVEGQWASGRTSDYDSHENLRVFSSSFDRSFRMYKLAGNNMVRIWAIWRMLEAEENDMKTGIIGFQMDMVKKYGIEPLFCLVGNFPVHGGRQKLETYKKHSGRGANFPKYLWKYYHQPEDVKHMGSILPPMDIYKKYLDFVYKNWGSDIRCWELSNEPGILGMPAKAYVDYLKYTHKYLKERNPSSLLLGNGVTGDFGMNVVKWCDQLNAADPNYVDYLDAIAFHPYACCLDYYNGSRDLYKQCIDNISATLARKKELWNTECYYIPTVRTKQINNGREKSRFGTNELQRHYLDSFCNGLGGAISPSNTSFFQRANRIVNLVGPTEIVAAQNALSFMLKDMTELKELAVNNQTRSGVFSNKSGSKALGFIYDMRPSGSLWKYGKADVKLLDAYGNEVKDKEIRLSYEPYYLTGNAKEVEKALKKSTFKVDSPVELFGRFFDGTLFVEALNVSGTPGLLEANIGKTPVQFDFSMNPEKAIINFGKVKTAPAGVKVLPTAASHVLPFKTTLANGSKVTLKIEGKNLKLICDVKDSNLKAADKDKLWTGSCVELFIDPAPFENLNVEKAPIMQYAFAALPSNTGATVLSVHSKKSKASTKSAVKEGGYVLEAVIPLDELPSGNIWGMDVIINRAGVKTKEALGNDPVNSFRSRTHYHLFKVPANDLLLNSDFAQSSFGDPAVWCYHLREGMSVDCANGIADFKAAKANVKPASFFQAANITPGKFKRGTLCAKVKYSNIKTAKPGRGMHGVYMAVTYNGGNCEYGYTKLRKDITGGSDWQIIQMDFKIPANAKYLNVNVGIGRNTTGSVSVDGVDLKLWEK